MTNDRLYPLQHPLMGVPWRGCAGVAYSGSPALEVLGMSALSDLTLAAALLWAVGMVALYVWVIR